MIWPIGFLILTLIKNWSDFTEPFSWANVFEVSVDALLAIAIGFAVSKFIGWLMPKKWYEFGRRRLAAVNNIQTETCYIGKSRRDGNMYFGWKTKDDGKFHAVGVETGIEIAVVDADHAAGPELRMLKRAFEHPIVYFLAIEPYDVMYEFHVPPGTYNPHLPDGTFA